MAGTSRRGDASAGDDHAGSGALRSSKGPPPEVAARGGWHPRGGHRPEVAGTPARHRSPAMRALRCPLDARTDFTAVPDDIGQVRATIIRL